MLYLPSVAPHRVRCRTTCHCSCPFLGPYSHLVVADGHLCPCLVEGRTARLPILVCVFFPRPHRFFWSSCEKLVLLQFPCTPAQTIHPIASAPTPGRINSHVSRQKLRSWFDWTRLLTWCKTSRSKRWETAPTSRTCDVLPLASSPSKLLGSLHGPPGAASLLLLLPWRSHEDRRTSHVQTRPHPAAAAAAGTCDFWVELCPVTQKVFEHRPGDSIGWVGKTGRRTGAPKERPGQEECVGLSPGSRKRSTSEFCKAFEWPCTDECGRDCACACGWC